MILSRRIGRLLTAAALVAPFLVVPSASATPRDAAGDHQVTICHVTNSATNPFVVITVDVAAFDGEGRNDHTLHLSKDGRVDELFVDGVCGGSPWDDYLPFL